MWQRKISYTAAYIAIKFYGLSFDPRVRSLFEPELLRYYERLVDELPASLGWHRKLLRSALFRKTATLVENIFLPGDLSHIILRKYYIQRYIEQARADGYRQLIVLGAGLDHSAVTASLNGMPSFELDAPGTSGFKADFIRKYGYNNDRLHILEIDLSHGSLSAQLHRHPDFDANAKTLAMAEGFFDYMTPHDMNHITGQLATISPAGLRLVTTVFALNELDPIRRWVYRNSVRAVGEELELFASLGEIIAGLNDFDFHVTEIKDVKQMNREVLQPNHISMPLLKGFYVLTSELNS